MALLYQHLVVSCEALVLLKAGHLEDAAAAAEEALQLNGHNSKAAFRQAQAGNRLRGRQTR